MGKFKIVGSSTYILKSLEKQQLSLSFLIDNSLFVVDFVFAYIISVIYFSSIHGGRIARVLKGARVSGQS